MKATSILTRCVQLSLSASKQDEYVKVNKDEFVEVGRSGPVIAWGRGVRGGG